MNWKKVGIVINHEYVTRVRKKSFILTTLLTPIGMGLLICLPALIMLFSGNDEQRVKVIDDSGIVAPYLEKADDGVMGELLSLYDFCQESGYNFYCLTSSSEKAIANWKEVTGAEYPFCLSDAVVLKTIIRSNPGLVLLHDGKVTGKWPSTALPNPKEIDLTK